LGYREEGVNGKGVEQPERRMRRFDQVKKESEG